MANTQLAQIAAQAKQDKEFNIWLQSIGKEGQKKIQEIFVKTAQQDQKLAQMAKEDPENTIILFAYQIFQEQKKKKGATYPETQET